MSKILEKGSLSIVRLGYIFYNSFLKHVFDSFSTERIANTVLPVLRIDLNIKFYINRLLLSLN